MFNVFNGFSQLDWLIDLIDWLIWLVDLIGWLASWRVKQIFEDKLVDLWSIIGHPGNEYEQIHNPHPKINVRGSNGSIFTESLFILPLFTACGKMSALQSSVVFLCGCEHSALYRHTYSGGNGNVWHTPFFIRIKPKQFLKD